MSEEFCGNSIAVAADCFHAGAIENCNLTTAIFDQAQPLKFNCGHCDSRATGAQYLRQ